MIASESLDPARVARQAAKYMALRPIWDQEMRRKHFIDLQRRKRDATYNAKSMRASGAGAADDDAADDDAGDVTGASTASSAGAISSAFAGTASPSQAAGALAGTAVSRRLMPVMARVREAARQLQLPEWMVTIPQDLNGALAASAAAAAGALPAGTTLEGAAAAMGWLVLPRPEGKQCLVTASGGTTTVRDSHGYLMMRCQTRLPGGGHGGGGGGGGASHTVLDCIFSEASHTFFVVDVLVWDAFPMHDWPYDQRRFWLAGKLEEAGVDTVVAASAAGASGRRGGGAGRSLFAGYAGGIDSSTSSSGGGRSAPSAAPATPWSGWGKSVVAPMFGVIVDDDDDQEEDHDDAHMGATAAGAAGYVAPLAAAPAGADADLSRHRPPFPWSTGTGGGSAGSISRGAASDDDEAEVVSYFGSVASGSSSAVGGPAGVGATRCTGCGFRAPPLHYYCRGAAGGCSAHGKGCVAGSSSSGSRDASGSPTARGYRALDGEGAVSLASAAGAVDEDDAAAFSDFDGQVSPPPPGSDAARVPGAVGPTGRCLVCGKRPPSAPAAPAAAAPASSFMSSAMSGGSSSANDFVFRLLPAWECDQPGLNAAYGHVWDPIPAASGDGSVDAVDKDGLLFCYKASAYTPGPTPLVLRWRDEGCSRFLAAHAAALSAAASTGSASADDHRYSVVLEVDVHGRLLTSDEVALGNITADEATAHGILPGDLIVMTVAGASGGDAPALLEPAYAGKAGGRRYHADCWTKILYQHNLRTAPLTAADIAAVATGGEGPPPAGGGVV